MQLVALNEAEGGSVRGVFRPWSQRLDLTLPTLDSNDDDPELLIHVPFNGCVKIKVDTLIQPMHTIEFSGTKVTKCIYSINDLQRFRYLIIVSSSHVLRLFPSSEDQMGKRRPSFEPL